MSGHSELLKVYRYVLGGLNAACHTLAETGSRCLGEHHKSKGDSSFCWSTQHLPHVVCSHAVSTQTCVTEGSFIPWYQICSDCF